MLILFSKPYQKFYTSLFPSWEFKPATAEYDAENIVLYSFVKPSGRILILHSFSLLHFRLLHSP